MAAATRSLVFIGPEDSAGSAGLFVSDETAAGTRDVQHLPASYGSATITGSAALPYILVFGTAGSLYATDPITGVPAPIAVANLASSPSDMVALGAVALFAATDSGGHAGLWRTDGTAGGTTEILPAGASLALAPTGIARVGSLAVFEGVGADGIRRLWETDGTSAGTSAIATFSASTSSIQPLGTIAGRLIFQSHDVSGTDYWSTDGTGAGTREYATGQVSASASVSLPNGQIVLTSGSQLASTDGSSATPQTFFYYNYASDTFFGVEALGTLGANAVVAETVSYLFFPSDQTYIATTDGSTLSPDVLFTTLPGSTLSGPSISSLTPFGDKALFYGLDSTATSNDRHFGLWITDGTSTGTQEIAPGVSPHDITVDGDRAYFLGLSGLYVTDGTATGTSLVAPLPPTSTAPNNDLILDPARVSLTGLHTQYVVAPAQDGSLQIVDTVPGRDGSAVYADARVIAFSDGVGVFDPTGNAGAVARIYEAAFHRVPDIGGLISYTEALDSGTVPLSQIAAAAANSPEFLADCGPLSNANFVTRLYLNADGRLPDPAGLAAYTGTLDAGTSRGAVLLDIAESFEARAHSVGVAGQANDAEIYRLYEAVLGRAPDPDGRQSYAAALASGQSPTELATAMLAGSEYALKFGAPDDATFVTELYRDLLQRAPDPGGLAAYTSALASGTPRAAVVAAFAAGTEGRAVSAAATHDGWIFLG